MNIKFAHLLDCAISSARKAGTHALHNFSRRSQVVKTFQHDIKLQLDIECQSKASSVIRSAFPEHDILGEEDIGHPLESNNRRAEYQWIIDPIDGTVNFFHGLTNWCCSVAVMYNGVTVAGAVYLPVLDHLYTATADQPAMMNNSRIEVSQTGKLADSMVLTGLDRYPDPAIPPFAIFQNISLRAQKTRIMGSAAADLCQVAAGIADGYYESGIFIWDIAAAGLIVERAGGKTQALKVESNHRLAFLATNGRIHSELLDIVE